MIMDKIKIIPKLDPSVIESLEVQWNNITLTADEDKCTSLCTIENYSKQNKPIGKVIESPIFTFEKDKQKKWSLQIYLGGFDEESEDYLSLFLRNLSENDVTINYTLAVLDFEGKKVLPKSLTGKLFDKKETTNSSWGYDRFFKKEDLIKAKERLLPDDNLTIFCSICSIGAAVETSTSRVIKKDAIAMNVAPKMNLLESMFSEDRFKDFKLIMDKKDIKVHKSVLAAASSVFQAMFEHDDMKDVKNNFAEIIDARYEVINQMVQFIYKGTVEDLSNIAQELLVVADKYDIQNLKNLCEQSLCGNLSVANVAELLVFADTYKTEHLKAASMNFIVSHKDDLVGTPEYEDIAKQQPSLILEAFSLTKPVKRSSNMTES